MAPRWLISIFLCCHLTALAVAAIPSPIDLRQADGRRPPAEALSAALGPLFDLAPASTDDAVSAHVRPVLDAANVLVGEIAGIVWWLTGPVRAASDSYVGSLGLAQGWKMFGNPPRGGEYLRLRYYSSRGPADADALTVATELVFPAVSDAERRLLAAYRQGHRDKAVSNAFTAYLQTRMRTDGRRAAEDGSPDPALARTFVPLVRYFSGRYAGGLGDGGRLVRTEAWYGWATLRARGDLPLAPRSRAAALGRYYRGVQEQPAPRPIFQPLDTIEREADVLWTLIYVETP